MTHLRVAVGAALALVAGGEMRGQAKTPARRSAETLIRAGAIHTMGPAPRPMRSIAIGEGRVLAVGEGLHDLDALVGKGTKVILSLIHI